MKEKKNITKWMYWFTFAVAIIIVYKLLDKFSDISLWLKRLNSILMPFFMGILIAYLFYIPCRHIESLYRKIKPKFINKRARGLSIITVYILAILLIILIINIIIPALSKSVGDLANNLPSYYQSAIDYANSMPEDSIIKKESVQEIINKLQKIDITNLLSLDSVSDYINKALGVANTIFNIFVSLIMSVYVLLERRKILEFFKKIVRALFTDDTYKAIEKYFTKSNDIFFRFISSQIIDAIVVGIIVSIALCIMGVKYWVLLGFIIGLFNIIPYFGAIVGIAISVIITIFTGGFSKAIWMLVVVIILQQIDGNIINPKIVGNALKLSPILVITSVTILGAYYGVLGMFLAVPIIAIIKILVNDYLDFRIENKKQKNKLKAGKD